MKMTLLDLVQDILSSLDSDEVNSISDTAEAQQVAKVVRTTYLNMLTRMDLPVHKKIFALSASGEISQPVLMLKPEEVRTIEWIKYNNIDTGITDPNFQYVTILPVQQFLDMSHQADLTAIEVEEFTLNGFRFFYRNDRNPTYCTILQENFIIFDSFAEHIESTLQTSKSLCFGLVGPTFSMTDLYVPDLDDNQFPLLLNEAKSLAFLELKQMPHPKAEKESRRQWSNLQRTKAAVKPNAFDSLPNFGRR